MAIVPLVVMSLVSAAPAALHDHTASGVVFHDANADGVRQTGENGIAGVAVTNGRDVVRTDARGRYTLPVTDDTIITVIKPAGYQVPLDGYRLPQHSYIHKPAGSPDEGFIFPGVEPTGPLPESIDFGLTGSPEDETFSVIVFGDPQPYSHEDVGFFRRDVIDPLTEFGDAGEPGNRYGAVFGISLGDLVGDQLELFGPLNQAQAMLGVPWYNVYGNHDMNFLSGDSSLTADDPDRYADETFERIYGSPNYAFQYGNAHFIVLDNVIYQGFDGFRDGEFELWPDGRKPTTGNYRGGLRPEQIDFVRNYLAGVPREDLIVLAFHIPIEGGGVHRIPEQRELFEALSSHPNTLSLSGHTHFQRHWFFGPEHGYDPGQPGPLAAAQPNRFDEPVHHHLNAVTASGSWYRGTFDEYGIPNTQMRDGAPNGYTLLHIDGNRYTTEFRASRRAADHQMSVSVNDANGKLTANIFNGAEGDAVHYRLLDPAAGSASWRPMAFAPGPDPLFAASHERETGQATSDAFFNRPVPRPQDAHHLWTADLPALPVGRTVAVEIRHLDLYGTERTHTHTISNLAQD
ncbi:MAG: calcineurin-like phosphoesterase family protein [Planctomycetota bacterium]